MKKTVIAAFGIMFVTAALFGCAGKAKGPTDQELINKLVSDWKAAGTAKNLDQMMACYSEAFKHYEWNDKAGLKSFLKDAMDMGYMEKAEFDMSKAKLTIEKEQAKYGPVELKAAFGTAGIDLTLKREGKDWKVIGMDVQQY